MDLLLGGKDFSVQKHSWEKLRGGRGAGTSDNKGGPKEKEDAKKISRRKLKLSLRSPKNAQGGKKGGGVFNV